MKNFLLLICAIAIFSTSCSTSHSDPEPQPDKSADELRTDSIANYYRVDIKGISGLNLHSGYGSKELFKYTYLSGNIGNKYWYGIFENGKAVYQKTYDGYPDTLMLSNGKIKTLDKFNIQRVEENNTHSVVHLYKTQTPVQSGDEYFSMKEIVTVVDPVAKSESEISVRVRADKDYFVSRVIPWYNGSYLVEMTRLHVDNGRKVRIYADLKSTEYEEVQSNYSSRLVESPMSVAVLPLDAYKYIDITAGTITIRNLMIPNEIFLTYNGSWKTEVLKDVPQQTYITIVKYSVDATNTLTVDYLLTPMGTNNSEHRIVKVDLSDGDIVN